MTEHTDNVTPIGLPTYELADNRVHLPDTDTDDTADNYELTDLNQVITDDGTMAIIGVDTDRKVVLRMLPNTPTDDDIDDGMVMPRHVLLMSGEQAARLAVWLDHAAQHLTGGDHHDHQGHPTNRAARRQRRKGQH